MARRAKELSALEVGRLSAEGSHAVGVVSGLQLQIIGGSKSWILRTMIGGKRRRMGLGAYPDVTLATARTKAREALQQIDRGVDPILERQQAASALRAQQAKALTFEEACRKFIDARSSEWKNPKHLAQWQSTLAEYAYPVMGKLHVEHIDTTHVIRVLEPIWTTKTETASRLRGRIEQVLDWAKVYKHREGENPARWRGHLDKLLAKPRKVSKVVHHPALPVDSVGTFMSDLRAQEGMGARALEFAILTAARSGEVRGATWAEIDIPAALWVIPASRMKAGKEHRVPLSKDAIKLLKAIPKIEGCAFVFPSPTGKALSDMTLSAVLRRMKVPAVPHGFRSTFRDWAAERTDYPSDMAEMALAHTLNSQVVAAYLRTDMFQKRAKMMTDWAAFCRTQSKRAKHGSAREAE